MALSPNYGWSEPDNSSLVKNGAADIRTLGDAIDTSLWNVGFGQAGKNKIINGDFSVWQRGTSVTASATGYFYSADRWVSYSQSGTSSTASRQTFTPGTAPVAGYEGQYFFRIVDTANACTAGQRIENVQTLAGQTATLSFWAKSASNVTGGINVIQTFGTGGSSQVYATVNSGGSPAFTTSWQRFTVNISMPSLTGKTIGTGSYVFINIVGGTNNALDIWGVQLEAGSIATPFQTATGTIQGELAACQRYYVSIASGIYIPIASAFSNSATLMRSVIPFPVTMRTGPSLVAASGTNYYMYRSAAADDLFNSLTIGDTGTNSCSVFNGSEIASTSGQGGYILTNNASASVAFSAEL